MLGEGVDSPWQRLSSTFPSQGFCEGMLWCWWSESGDTSCGWWHLDKYLGAGTRLWSHQEQPHINHCAPIKLYWKHSLQEYVLCLQGAVYFNGQPFIVHCPPSREAVCVVPQSKTLAKLSIVMEICYQDIMDFSPNQRALKVERAAPRTC